MWKIYLIENVFNFMCIKYVLHVKNMYGIQIAKPLLVQI